MMKRSIFTLLLMATLGLWAQDYAENSVLSEGQWYKIGVTEPGIYRLDQSFLSSLGLNLGSIDPRQIQLFGHGAGMLPQPNATTRPDDLVELAIEVQGEGDGSFDAGDQVIFYGEGPSTWAYNTEAQRFAHQIHHYADTNYYFLRVGQATGLRVSAASDPGPATYTPTQLHNFHFHEATMVNPMESGRIWMGEQLSSSNHLRRSFYLPDVRADGQVRIVVRVAARAEVPTFFAIEANGTQLETMTVAAANLGSDVSTYYYTRQQIYTLPASVVNANDSLHLRFTYLDNNSSRAEGWLDWIEVEYDQAPDLGNRPVWLGSLLQGTATGAVADLNFSGASNAYRAWDVSDPLRPQRLSSSVSGGQLSLKVAADTIRRLAVFREANRVPVSGRPMGNQNLHGLPLVDYLVITHPAFVAPAERLAQFHRDHYGRSAAVVTVPQILNEFSSGKMDPTALRDFIRMQWVRSAGMTPGFVCLFGDGSYVYKYVSEATNPRSNFVPTYQSRDSDSPVRTYASDDFYGMMDEEDGFWGENSGVEGDQVTDVSFIDVALGRLPVETVEQGNDIVDKIIRYAKSRTEDLGEWRNRLVLVGDYRENERGQEIFHIEQADGYTNQIQNQAPCMTIDKIFMDNYRMVVTAGAESFPDGRAALLSAWDRGSLILNYTGHGGENAWSYAGIFQNSDINALQNEGRFPAVVTATCEYGRYDNPNKRSGGEMLVMVPDRGAIALFTTGRLVYSSFNATLNTNFYRHAFTFDSLKGRYLTLGEIMMRTKNSSFAAGAGTNINSRNFTLLGDPGLILNYPRKHARITHINGQPLDPNLPDTLRSLGQIQVRGVIEDELGGALPDFSGDMAVNVFDKPTTYITQRAGYTFRWQNNRIFRGQSQVEEGAFEFEFVVPIDISYENGRGKVALYFNDQEIDGVGCINDLYVGGTDPDAQADQQGPRVDLYLNDTTWQDGSTVGPNPDLYAVVFDENGINTTGNGIGREIIAVLDNDDDKVFVLNDFYQADPGSYQRGSIRYPLSDLPVGEHTLRIRVWDVANNASEDETTFLVADDLEMVLDQLVFYPNPISRSGAETGRFLISHNQPGEPLQVQVQVMTTDGRVVRRLQREFVATDNTYDGLEWNVNGEDGQALSSGIYIFQVVLAHQENGKQVSRAEKLVVIR
mgnify:CR=1 FL=1